MLEYVPLYVRNWYHLILTNTLPPCCFLFFQRSYFPVSCLFPQMNSIAVLISFIFFENIIWTMHSDNNKMKCVASIGLFKNLVMHTQKKYTCEEFKSKARTAQLLKNVCTVDFKVSQGSGLSRGKTVSSARGVHRGRVGTWEDSWRETE